MIPEQSNPKRNKLFLKLLLEHQPKIHAYILSLVPNHSDADDILQDVSSLIWSRFDQFEEGTNFLSWALRFAFFEVLNFRSRKGKSRSILFDNEVLQQIAPILDEEMRSSDIRREALEKCIERLSERGKEVIQMKYDKGLTAKQISSQISLSLHGVYKLLGRLHSQLLSCVQQIIRKEGYLHG